MSATAFLHQGGGNWVLQILTGVISKPSTLSIGLRQLDGVGSHPADAAYNDVLSNATTLAEVTTTSTGYGRISQALNSTNFPITQNGGGDYLFTSGQVTFSFTGPTSVTGITHAMLIDTTNSVLIGSTPLQAVRNVGASDTIKDIFTFQLTHN